MRELAEVTFDVVQQWEGLAELYIRDGEFVKPGDIIKRPKLARTLRRLAEDGAMDFYTGSLANDIVTELQQAGGHITMEDLADYRVQWREPLRVPYQYFDLHLAGPPFGGAVMALAMNIIEHDELILDDPESVHLLIESWKWAFSDRMVLGDPAFTADMDEILNAFVSKDHAQSLRSRISATRTFPVSYYSDLMNVTRSSKVLEDHGTMHLNVVDRKGNLVALTSTINLEWGCKYVGAITGIVYNNQMDDFSTAGYVNHFGVPPTSPNYIAPGKRPMSSMNPTVITKRGDPVMAVGASGGTRIITSPMQAILNVLSFGLDVGKAIGLSRIHEQLLPDTLSVERGYSQDLLDSLAEYGHDNVSFYLPQCGC